MLTKSVAYFSFHECWLYHNYESANTCTTPAAASLASAVDVDDLQAWRMVHISVVSRNCSVLARIRGPYSKTNFLHCQDIRINKNYLLAIYSKMTLSISILKIRHIYNSLKSLFWEVDVPYFIQFLWLLSPFLQTCPQNYMPSRAPRLSLAEWNKKSISRLPCNTNNFLDKIIFV